MNPDPSARALITEADSELKVTIKQFAHLHGMHPQTAYRAVKRSGFPFRVERPTGPRGAIWIVVPPEYARAVKNV